MQERVEHIIWGGGYIEHRDERYVRIVFDDGDIGTRTFVWPDAFGKYLRYTDAAVQSEVEAQLREAARLAAEREEHDARERREALLAKTQAQEDKAQKRRRALAYAHARNKKLTR